MQQDWKSLQIISLSFFIGILLFMGVTMMLYYSAGGTAREAGGLSPLLGGGALAIIGLAWFLNQRQLAKVSSEGGLSRRFADYRAKVILRLAMIEGAALLALVGFHLESQLWLLIVVGVALGAFYLLRPSKEEFAHVYRLTARERKEIGG